MTDVAMSGVVTTDEILTEKQSTGEGLPDTASADRDGTGESKKKVMHMNISSDVIRGYNDTIILYLLLDAPSYGYEISRRIRELSEEKYVIKETTLYSAFTRMEKNGYIESFYQTAENGKRRTYYKITESGRQYYQEKCAEWQLTKEVVERFILDLE